MKEEIEKLIHLQAVDSEIAGFDRSIDKHKEEVINREQAIVAKQETILALKNKIELLNQKQRETKAEHEDAATRVKDRQNKMMQVQTTREHQALFKEIEESKKLAKDTEDLLLQFIEQIEHLEEEITNLENLCAGEKKLLTEAQETAEKEIRQIESSRKNIVLLREEGAATLQPAHLKRYTMLLGKRQGLAVVAIYGTVCQGCHMSLPPQQVIDVRKGDKLLTCPTCQRMLYYKEQEDEASVDS